MTTEEQTKQQATTDLGSGRSADARFPKLVLGAGAFETLSARRRTKEGAAS